MPSPMRMRCLWQSIATDPLLAWRDCCAAEGLHLIDFEQLKIENQSLNEKIEERNEELIKLRKKTTVTVQVWRHRCQDSRWHAAVYTCKNWCCVRWS